MLEIGDVFVSLTTFSITFLLLALLRRNGKQRNKKRRPPCLPALPIVGSFPFFRGSIEEMPRFFMEKAETLGPIFHFYAGSKLAAVLNDRKSIFDALQRHSESFADRPDFWTESHITNLNLKGIMFAHYPDSFKHNHKLALSVLKEFGFDVAKDTEFRISEVTEVLLKEISEHRGRPIYLKHMFATITVKIMIKILFGRQAASLIDPNEMMENANAFVIRLEPKINNAPIIRFLPKYRKMISEMISFHDKMLELLEEAIKHGQSDDSENNFVKRYMEIEGSDYDHENLLYIVRDLVLGSADTVSTTVQWVLIDLANHPDVQTRLQQEIDALVSNNMLPSLLDKPNLPYAEAVMLESMRLHTLAPLGLPHVTIKDTEVCGYHIPQGCMVIANIYGAHMDPKVWIDPENFRPERFLDKDNKLIGKQMVIPFGLGKRSCTGQFLGRQQTFLLFTALVQHFDILPPEGQKSVEVKEECTLSVRPSPFEIRLIPRRDA